MPAIFAKWPIFFKICEFFHLHEEGYSTGFKSKTPEYKITDLKLAAHVACHGSIKNFGHLGALLKKLPREVN